MLLKRNLKTPQGHLLHFKAPHIPSKKNWRPPNFSWNFSKNPVLWCICCMYLIDRFSQLIRCWVALDSKNTWDINDLTLKYYKKATSTTPLTLRTCHGCVYTGTFVLDNHALYLQHFMCIEHRNPMSSFSGTGRSTNSQCRLKGFVTV